MLFDGGEGNRSYLFGTVVVECDMYLCDLRSNMCNSSFHSGLNPSSATLFTTWFRTTVAISLQKAASLVRSNSLKTLL